MDVREMLSKAMDRPVAELIGVERLCELERWDSLAILNFMALADANRGVTIAPEKLLQCESIADIECLINDLRGMSNASLHQVN